MLRELKMMAKYGLAYTRDIGWIGRWIAAMDVKGSRRKCRNGPQSC